MGSFVGEAVGQLSKAAAAAMEVAPMGARAMERAVQWLEQSKVLRVINPLIPVQGGESRPVNISDYGHALDLPWPVTAIEYEHGGVYDVEQDFTRALSTRRIALCVGITSAMAPEILSSDEDLQWGALMVWPISFFDEKNEWELSPGAVIIPRAQAQQELAFAENPYLQLMHDLEQLLRSGFRRQPASAPGMVATHQVMLPELCEKVGPEHARKMMKESSMDALWVALGVFSAMGCKNVVIDRDARTLHVVDSSNRLDLDPFQGVRKLDLLARPQWRQQVRTNIFA